MIEPGCLVTDATLTWGFKESFRAYIGSDIANGEWTTAGGATYATPEFRWTQGTGHYDPATGTAFVQFTGSVRFTGHDGLLDTTIADPALSMSPDSNVLLLDVSGPSMEGEQIDAEGVAFVGLPGLQLGAEDYHVTIESTAVLTDDGEAAFPDYQAGTDFDPVTLELELDQCSTEYFEADEPPASTPAWIVAGAVLGPLVIITAVVSAILLLIRRRRAGS